MIELKLQDDSLVDVNNLNQKPIVTDIKVLRMIRCVSRRDHCENRILEDLNVNSLDDAARES